MTGDRAPAGDTPMHGAHVIPDEVPEGTVPPSASMRTPEPTGDLRERLATALYRRLREQVGPDVGAQIRAEAKADDLVDAVLPVVEAWAAEIFTTERRREPDSLTVYPAHEGLYGRCGTCDQIRWQTEFHEEGRGAGKRSSHCGCCTHAHDLEPGGHEITRGESR